ncbi:MAG: hypothetical protein U1E65_34945 [Myxococcota bacterium]
MKYRPALLWSLALSLSSPAWAQLPGEALVCRDPGPDLDRYAYLRALTLDLAGRLPTPEEMAALDGQSEVPEATIDALLASDAFVDRAVRFHRSILWNNVQNVDLMNFQSSLGATSEGIYWRRTPGFVYRGDGVPCANTPATFDAEGNIEFTTDALGVRREGWVNVAPYWDPAHPVKICAFDAQAAAVSKRGTRCDTLDGYQDAGCGCGPSLNRCRLSGPHNAKVTGAIREDIDRRVAALIRSDRPYIELFTSRRAFVNGPLVHYLRYQAPLPAGATLMPLAMDLDQLPDLAWTDEAFSEIELGPEHAGVLTSLSYLLRFQTNRARAAHFFDAFLCSPLSPPPGGIPIDPTERPTPNLQKRDGCKYCHALLEPTGAHWARWTERGAGFLAPDHFPASREDCRRCAQNGLVCSPECRLYYLTTSLSAEDRPYFGWLNAYAFLRPEHQKNAELGPKLLIEGTVIDDRFPRCAARRATQNLLGRQLSTEELVALDDAAHRFVESGMSYKALIKAIVTSPVYRRVR